MVEGYRGKKEKFPVPPILNNWKVYRHC